MEKLATRILVVDDFEPWRSFLCAQLSRHPNLQLVGEASDGLEAVQKAQQLRPDLIVLDIGLPALNGIEAAKLIRELVPLSKIIFASEQRSIEIVKETFSVGARGYLVKSDAGQLISAIEAVLRGTKFLSASLRGQDYRALRVGRASEIQHCHEVTLYSDDDSLVSGYASFIESSLKDGSVVIAVVTEAHAASLLSRLRADGVNVPALIEQGRYMQLDAIDTLAKLTINDMPNPAVCSDVIRKIITGATKRANGMSRRVAVCGEIAPTLLSMGNAEGAITIEHLWDEITREYGVHTLCGYSISSISRGSPTFDAICAEHSAVYYQ